MCGGCNNNKDNPEPTGSGVTIQPRTSTESINSKTSFESRDSRATTACPRSACGEKKEEGENCCDDSCLDTLASRECEEECGDRYNKRKDTIKNKTDSSACDYHTKSARDKYADTLEALGCICRALLARNLETCCSPSAPSPLRQRKGKRVTRAVTPVEESTSCCATGACGQGSAKATGTTVTGNIVRKTSRSSVKSAGKNSCKKGCCGTKTPAENIKSVKKEEGGCCSSGVCSKETAPKAPDIPAASVKMKKSCDSIQSNGKNSCKDGCCGTKKQTESIKKAETGCCASGTCAKDKPGAPGDTGANILRKSSCDSVRSGGNEGCKAGCCGTNNTGGNAITEANEKRESTASSTSSGGSCGGGCCGSAKEPVVSVAKVTNKSSCDDLKIEKDGCKDACCSSEKEIEVKPPKDSCCSGKESGCCSGNTPANESLPLYIEGGQEIDVEKGGVNEKERVVLSVSGMTCTGCETKLFRTLNSLPHVTNVKASLSLSRVEFTVDGAFMSVADVVKHLERTTDFNCQIMTQKGAELYILPSCSPKVFVEQTVLPKGVIEAEVVDKQTVRVIYDPDIVGARDLFEDKLPKDIKLAEPRPDPSLDAGSKHVRNVGLTTLLSIILTIPVLVLAWAPLPDYPLIYGSVSLALATIIQVFVAGPFYPAALKSLIFSKMVEMDLLIVLSTSAAYIFSVVSFAYIALGKPLDTGEFFETSTLLITLIMVGRYLGAMARQKAVESVSISSLQSPSALLVVDGTKQRRELDARLLQYGDVFEVSPETSIVTDGTVISGESEVDESLITGESKPAEKSTGSPVIAGSINSSGTLVVRLTRLPGDNTISTVASMVDEARFSKPKVQDLADRVASYFVPVVVTLTIIVFAIWMGVGIGIRKQSGSAAATNAITYAIAVLIVSCPCAIGLAVPMVIVMASGVAAKHGVIFKSGEAFDQARKVNHIVFDKTGTLTQGKHGVIEEHFIPSEEYDIETIQSLLVGLVGNIKHPVSQAVTAYLQGRGIKPAASVHDSKTVPGKGVSGSSNGLDLRAGNSRWLECENIPTVQQFLFRGYTVFCFAIGDHISAIFGLEDTLRLDTAPAVAELQRRNIKISIVSGDDESSVSKVADALNIDPSCVYSRQKPEDKQAYVESLLEAGNCVLFCGDGTNDAAALAQASIGVHMGDGTDIAKGAADAVLVRPSLERLIVLLDISKDAYRRIFFNFSWSFVYNLFAVLLAAGAFVKARIPPEFAGLGEIVSVLPVILVGVQMRQRKFGRKEN